MSKPSLAPHKSATFLVLLSLFAAVCMGQTDDDTYDFDPYLKYRPAFARSLPIQILLTGIVLTLVAVLFIHLIFTAQYHWPLAPVNYVLQLSGVTTLLISLIATLHVVLSAALSESEKWPYMLSYIAVNVPPLDLNEDTEGWSIAERATWLVMNASTSGLIQITHIQFLTLLYPSRLEGRLIFALLGPLAIVAAIMQLLPIHGSVPVNNFASAVRNVCNATLSILFTASLFIWGLLVNRRQAWRTDGGTAAFGCAALTLAVVSTGLNCLYVPREEEYVWLPGLMWAVVLWQSFLGWWWWVGAGSGSGLAGDDDVEEKMRREAKRESSKKEAREPSKKKDPKGQRAKKVWRDVAGAFSNRGDGTEESGSDHDRSARRRRRQRAGRPPPESGGVDGDSPQQTADDRTSSVEGSTPMDVHAQDDRDRERMLSVSPSRSSPPRNASVSGVSSPSVVTSAASFTTLPRLLPQIVHRWYASLRHAHLAAARQQAVERVERIRQLENAGANGGRRASTHRHGWGLGSFGWRIGSDRGGSPGGGVQNRQWVGKTMNDEDDDHDVENDGDGQRGRPQLAVDIGNADEGTRGDGEELVYPPPSRATAHDRHHSRYSSLPQTAISPGMNSPRLPLAGAAAASSPGVATTPPIQNPQRPRSLWWWGPLRRWRLQDSTVY